MSQWRISRSKHLRLIVGSNRDWSLSDRYVGRNERDRIVGICQCANRDLTVAHIFTTRTTKHTSQRIANY